MTEPMHQPPQYVYAVRPPRRQMPRWAHWAIFVLGAFLFTLFMIFLIQLIGQ